jgi:GINS complex subunit 1
MNYGSTAKDLLLDLKRSDWLPPYNEEGVRSCLSEITHHLHEMNDIVNASRDAHNNNNYDNTLEQPQKDDNNELKMEARPAILLHHAAIQRNKRCLLAYHSYRLNKIKDLRWETTAASLPSHIRNVLSEAELDFYSEYDTLLSNYCTSLSSGSNSSNFVLDLNSNIQPPEEDLVEVRVVQNGLGTIVTEQFGQVSLEMGTTHFLSRSDVEHLIRQGALQQLDGEETY